METSKLKTKLRITPVRTFGNSFISFWGNLFNFSGKLYEYNPDDPNVADANAIAEDWRAVGDDIRNAMGSYEKKTRIKTSRTVSSN